MYQQLPSKTSYKIDKLTYWKAPNKNKDPVYTWSGLIPPLTRTTVCPECDCQTQNMKPNDIYSEIEANGDEWIEMACQEATESVDQGGGPFGAVILRIDPDTHQILEYWKNHNHTQEWSDPTAHAEISTIRLACRELAERYQQQVYDLGNLIDPNTKKRSFCVIYSSCEPCPMCYSAIKWAGIPHLIFAATRFDAAVPGVEFSDQAIYEDLDVHYKDRMGIEVRQASCSKSLDAFNTWKRRDSIHY